MARFIYNTTVSTTTTTEGGSGLTTGEITGIVSAFVAAVGVLFAILTFLGCQGRCKTDNGCLQGATQTNNPAKVAAKSCREALRALYNTTGSYVKLIPWEDAKTKHIKDIFTKLTLENSGKKLESYRDIFLQKKNGSPIKRFILNGLAGRGKSTIMDKMACDWARGEALQHFKLVFVLRMRAVKQSTELIDYVFDQLLVEDTKIDRVALDSFISENQEKVLILLDGFDELMTPVLDKTLFGSILKILNSKKDKDCYVVVTTRPSHYDKLVTGPPVLVEEPFTQVRVKGFDKEGVEEYVKRFYLEEDDKALRLLQRIKSSDKAQRLLQRIKSSNVLSDLAKSPMLLLLMCILWRDNSTLPETMSRIYSEALEYIFHRKTDEDHRPMSPDEISKLTKALGKIGLHGLLDPEQQLAFPEEVFESSVLELAIKAGILTRQKVSKEGTIHRPNSIQFLHKTFQEFCGGKYLQSLLETDTVEFEKNLTKMCNSGEYVRRYRAFRDNDFEYVLRFCAGDNMACTSSILKTLLKPQSGNSPLNVQLGLNCYFEGHSQDLLPVEFIEYVVSDGVHVGNYWERDGLNSLTYFLQNVHTHAMENKHTDYLDKVQLVHIQDCHLGGCMSDLAYCMSLMVNLSSVALFDCSFNDSSEERVALSGATSCPIGSDVSWENHFKEMMNLEELTMNECSLTDTDMTHIAPALCDLPKLAALTFDRNEHLGGSAALWVHHFKKMKKLQKLKMCFNALTGTDMKHIAPAVCDLPKLVELDLRGNKDIGGSAALWAHHFKKMKNLQNLILGDNSLTGTDMKHIAPALCDLPKLVELKLWDNRSLGGSAALWAYHFKKMKNLQRLDLTCCLLTDDDLTHTAPALCHLPKLIFSHWD